MRTWREVRNFAWHRIRIRLSKWWCWFQLHASLHELSWLHFLDPSFSAIFVMCVFTFSCLCLPLSKFWFSETKMVNSCTLVKHGDRIFSGFGFHSCVANRNRTRISIPTSWIRTGVGLKKLDSEHLWPYIAEMSELPYLFCNPDPALNI